MTDNLPPFLTEFNDTIKDTEVFLSIARASELQQDALEALERLSPKIAEEKARAVKDKNEDYANMLLGCECVAAALIAELKMWILLKQEEPEAAWNQLVSAQNASLAAARAHDSFSRLALHYQRLEEIEQLVFPPQVFLSVGLIAKRQECSVCKCEYEDCEHLACKPYMGQFCSIRVHEIESQEASIVEYPADKRCRIIDFSVEGGRRNRMTWRIEKGGESSCKLDRSRVESRVRLL